MNETTQRTSSMVVVLRPDDPVARRDLLRWLLNEPGVDVGDARQSLRLPIATEHPDRDAERAFWKELNAHPGVAMVHLVFHHIHTDAQEPSDASSSSDPRRDP